MRRGRMPRQCRARPAAPLSSGGCIQGQAWSGMIASAIRRRGMGKTRLEAFSDGVLAVAITIMVLEMKVPHDPSPAALQQLWPVFLSYVLSFIYVGIYWNNHHHMLHVTQKVS